MKKSKNNKGITLITLAITIIVILILAGISVATLFGENGLFKSALTAKEKTEIASYQEIINLSTTYAHTNNKETNPEEILKKIKEELQKEEKFKEAKITGPDKNEEEQKLIIVTKEGYVFYVYEENNKYIGKKEEIGETELNIEIKEGHIKYTYKPSEWTNQDVEVGIEITKEEYKQYQIEYTYTPKENNSWKEYKEGEIVEKTNGRTIYARLTNGLSATKIYVAGTITNIDKDKPTIGQITNNLPIVIGNTGKIEVKEIKDPGGSELKGYYVSTKDEVPTKESVTWQPNTSSSFEYPVTEAGKYNIWVIDNAGNVSDKKTCIVTTQTAIAKVGNTYYSSITNAIDATTTGEIIVLENTTESLTIPAGKTIILNLNEKTITGNIAIYTNGICTITGNGKVVGISDKNVISNSGTLYLYYTTLTTEYANTNIIVNAGSVLIGQSTLSLKKSGSIGSGYVLYSSGISKIEQSNIYTEASGIMCIDGKINLLASDAIANSEYSLLEFNSTGTGKLDAQNCVMAQNGSGYVIRNDRGFGSCITKNMDVKPGKVIGPFEYIYQTDIGYVCHLYGLNEGQSKVYFPTCTTYNGEDDLQSDLSVYEGEFVLNPYGLGDCYRYTVLRSDHNNEKGEYKTAVYYTDTAGVLHYVTEYRIDFGE